MGLKRYAAKRDFRKTPEPSGLQTPPRSPGSRPLFVVHRHEASHLHWDLRLEEEGVLRSWAIPKEPLIAEGVRRLAVQVEDHPLAYASFEGTIPEGEYGAGTVEIWDRGTFGLVESTSDKRVLDFAGTKLSGPYALVRLKPEEKGRNWLFFKMKAKKPAGRDGA
jgi:DNA ligase D-like protein (predicted 3'-phosphoesterase)